MKQRLIGNAINAPAFIKFINRCSNDGIAIHSFRFFRDGELVVGADMAPYSPDDPMQIYSLSKSFTSIAVGIACDEGILSLDERACDIFSDKMPAVMSENLKNMTLRDILTMQSGHPVCVFDRVVKGDDSIRIFFSSDTPYVPGTKFVYSTAGTMVCGAAVTRRSGESLVDYLDKRLFAPLGINKPDWDVTDDGICQGGVGLRLTAESIAKFGQLLLNRGVYNGKRIVSAEYIDDATVSHSIDVTNGSPDWISGYGYQMWINNPAVGGYRGDGAFGQLCIVLPEKREVFAILCECNNMQNELDMIFDFIKDSVYPDDTDMSVAVALTENEYAAHRTTPLAERIDYVVGENNARIFGISLVPDGEKLVMELDCDFGKQRIVCGNGEYIRSSVKSVRLVPSIVQLHRYGLVEPFNVLASYENNGGEVTVTLRHYDLPHTQTWTFTDTALNVSPSCGGVVQTDYKLMRR